jgi:hypothetical protein
MLNLRKTALAVLVLSSGASFAGTMGPVCSAVNVTVPCESTAWHVGGQALYLQPTTTAGSLNYTLSDAAGAYLPKPNNWNWGFQLEGAYHYGTGSDTNLNWYHLNNTNTKTTQGPFNIIAGAGTTFNGTNQATTTLNPKWDEVNLEFGQRIDVADMKSIRFHGGVQYARIDNTGSLLITGVSNRVYTSQSITYNGFGPRIGLDFDYNWGNGVGVYARGASSLLAGTSKFNNETTGNVSIGSAAASITGSATTVVPELESKLGIKYDYAMAQGDLTLDFGWLWLNYFNAEPSVSGATITSGDFGLQGLYFGLKWTGNVV